MSKLEEILGITFPHGVKISHATNSSKEVKKGSIFFGLPTIMNNNIGLSHYLRPNKDFLLINEFNNIHKVINNITNDKILSLKRSMQKKARIFNMSDVSKEYFKFYNLGSNNLWYSFIYLLY